MIKFPHLIFAFLFAVLLLSCSGDNLYEFEDLTEKKDFIIEVVVIPEDLNEPFDFQATFFQTNGYGERVKKSVSYSTRGNYQVVYSAAKEYGEAGVTFMPVNNVSIVGIRIFDLLYDTDLWYSTFEDTEGNITVSYDFELDEAKVIRD